MEKLSSATRKVFLSYAFKDIDKIEIVNMKLRERGFEVIPDRTVISNEKFTDFFTDSIDNCDCFILIITDCINENSLMEYNIALKRGKSTFVYIKKDIFKGEIKEIKL